SNRKKLMTTSQYIYRTLFLEGQNSDVTIVALGVDWCLHKVYLCQSPYFASMFCGSWKEREEGIVEVGIEDPRVTCEALKIVFGSLYLDEIVIDPENAIPVLATATLFQLDELIQLCSETMEETIKLDTVLPYHEVAEQYALAHLGSKCLEWLERNLMFLVNDSADTLRQIGSVPGSHLAPSTTGCALLNDRNREVLFFFSLLSRMSSMLVIRARDIREGRAFSEPAVCGFSCLWKWIEYAGAFEALRIEHLINHPLDVEMLELDNIISKGDIFSRPICTRLFAGSALMPKSINEDEFNRCCLRCGRILNTDAQHIWRWTGYNFGVDLIVTYQGRSIKFRRNDRSEPDVLRSAVVGGRRHLLYRLAVFSVGPNGDAHPLASTGLRSATLARNAETKVLTIEKEFKFPLIISANFLVTTPLSTSAASEATAAELSRS
ncbi:conserved hypothetical protein, partial [Ixodes scapularis]